MIGLLVVQLLKLAGAGRIIAVDINGERLALADRFGATHLLRSDRDDVPAVVRSLSHGRGADVVLEAVGAGPTVGLAIACARKGGALTLIGNLAPRVEVPLQEIVLGELTLRGTTNAATEWDACLQMLSTGAVDVDALISTVAPLAEGAEWFARLRGGEPGLMKVILQP
jgi:L-iditol 2-dehydrogenase